MGVDRKCPKCKEWSIEKDICPACGEILSPKLIEQKRSAKRKPLWERRETAFDRFISRWKNSRFLFLRVLYKILYTIGVIFFTIAGFFAYLAATPNG